MLIFSLSCLELFVVARVSKLDLILPLTLRLKLASFNIELATYSNNEDKFSNVLKCP